MSSGSTVCSSRFSVSGPQSANTGVNPRMAKALAVETKVNDGTMTSSPGRASSRSADISSAAVHEFVRSAVRAPVISSRRDSQPRVYGPFPDSLPLWSACVTHPTASASIVGRLNGIR